MHKGGIVTFVSWKVFFFFHILYPWTGAPETRGIGKRFAKMPFAGVLKT